MWWMCVLLVGLPLSTQQLVTQKQNPSEAETETPSETGTPALQVGEGPLVHFSAPADLARLMKHAAYSENVIRNKRQSMGGEQMHSMMNKNWRDLSSAYISHQEAMVRKSHEKARREQTILRNRGVYGTKSRQPSLFSTNYRGARGNGNQKPKDYTNKNGDRVIFE